VKVFFMVLLVMCVMFLVVPCFTGILVEYYGNQSWVYAGDRGNILSPIKEKGWKHLHNDGYAITLGVYALISVSFLITAVIKSN